MTRTLYLNAGLLLIASAVLHLAAIVAGAGLFLIPLVFGAAICGIVGWALMGERRWLAYTALLVALGSGCIAFAAFYETNAPQNYAFIAILVADWAAAFLLFRLLWRARDTA